MKLGLVSDTHGQNVYIERARDLFRQQEIDQLIHTGDVTRVKHLTPLLELEVLIHLVMGNMDRRQNEFESVAETGAFTYHGSSGQFAVDGRTISFTHGHLDSTMRALRSDSVYLIHGHTHERRDEMYKSCRILNPGSVKPPSPSVAVLNIESDSLQFFSLDD